MLSGEVKLEIKEMFRETPWKIDDINTISDEEIKNKLMDCANHPISNEDILVACRGYNFAYIKGRALLRQKVNQILEQMGIKIENDPRMISNEDILLACDSLNFFQLYQRALVRESTNGLLQPEENREHRI